MVGEMEKLLVIGKNSKTKTFQEPENNNLPVI
jgi:hypothetical protein